VQGRVDTLLGVDDQRQVQVAGEQVGDQVLRAALVDVQLDVGVLGAEPAQHRRHQRRAEARGGADPDPAAAQPDDLLDRVAGGVRVGDHPARQRQQGLAGRGEPDRTADTLEERRAESLFEAVNLLT
jgi:hypothetical protein